VIPLFLTYTNVGSRGRIPERLAAVQRKENYLVIAPRSEENFLHVDAETTPIGECFDR
jgi:hypothetical protein